MGKPLAKVRTMLNLNERVASIDSQFSSESEFSLIDTIADEGTSSPEQSMVDSNLLDNLGNWIDELTEIQQEVVGRRFGLRGHDPSTLEKVGQQIGLTRERVRQIQVQALKSLHEKFAQQGLSSTDVLDSEI